MKGIIVSHFGIAQRIPLYFIKAFRRVAKSPVDLLVVNETLARERVRSGKPPPKRRYARRVLKRRQLADSVSSAAGRGELELLYWLRHTLRVPASVFSEKASGAAAQHSLCTLHFVHKTLGARLTLETMRAAIDSSETTALAKVQWLHAHSCPWDSETFTIAVACGNVDVVQYLYEVGCPINRAEDFSDAARGDAPMLRWLRDHLRETSYEREFGFFRNYLGYIVSARS